MAKLEKISPQEAQLKLEKLEEKEFSLENTYQHLQSLMSEKYLVDKSPTYAVDKKILEKAELMEKKPFYIHLVRHPLSVIESFVKNRFDKMLGIQEDPRKYAEKIWYTYNSNILDFLTNIPQKRWAIISYEELVQNPSKIVQQLCSRLQLKFEEEMLNPYGKDRMIHGIHENSLTIGDPNFLKHNKIETRLANSWERHLDKVSQMSKETIILAKQFGYSFTKQDTKQKLYPLAPAPLT